MAAASSLSRSPADNNLEKMDKSPILPAEHDPACRRAGRGALDTERCERCRNLLARLDQWRGTSMDSASDAIPTLTGGNASDSDTAHPDEGAS